ncbi:MAG TPA: TetR family transcriptional regulator [Candidatus Dormibacteraeota bacterium]|nr:TetR family transcriptional regulator [Candidatus Dormibacteraeota bacterium]
MRRRLSERATELFLERGFDGVRVSEIAEACGVSEKTVFNYFPTKESLILDRWEGGRDALRVLADPAVPPVDAVLAILSGELTAVTSWLAAQEDPDRAADLFLRFGDLLRSTPALRAHQHETAGALVAVAAAALADRTGLVAQDPEPQIAAAALLELWGVQFRSLRHHLRASAPADLQGAVTADVRRAARLIDAGLRTLPDAPPESGG